MRVIRNQSGWDIALDMVFIDKDTADTIAKRIQHAVHALVRDAVDTDMGNVAKGTRAMALSATQTGRDRSLPEDRRGY